MHITNTSKSAMMLGEPGKQFYEEKLFALAVSCVITSTAIRSRYGEPNLHGSAFYVFIIPFCGRDFSSKMRDTFQSAESAAHSAAGYAACPARDGWCNMCGYRRAQRHLVRSRGLPPCKRTQTLSCFPTTLAQVLWSGPWQFYSPPASNISLHICGRFSESLD